MGFGGGMVLVVVALAAVATVAHPMHHVMHLGLGSTEGLVGESMEQEMMMESETGRRMLKQAGHISYGALNQNNIPCNQRGQSYYNCRGHQKANPYTRGCSRITNCARTNR